MRSTTLFGIYAAIIIALLGVLGGLALFSIEKSRSWDDRIQLAQESYSLHLKLEANLYRLFKQYGDALLVGARDGGEQEAALRADIARNISSIRNTIAREIELVGEEEFEELEHLDILEAEIRKAYSAIEVFLMADDRIDNPIRTERLAALLNSNIDMELDRLIDFALEEEREEVDEVLAEASAFRTWNVQIVYGILLSVVILLVVGLLSFNWLVRRPILRLQNALDKLRSADYSTRFSLGGCLEFKQLSQVLNEMAEVLSERESSRAEQRRHLEKTVAARTRELQQMIDKLETGEENRKRLMADISHELRTPLAIILGEAEVTLRGSNALSEDASDALARIRESARHTNQIVDDLLTVARFEAGQLRLDRRETDVRNIVGNAIVMFPGNVMFVRPDTPMLAQVDEVRLRQSILALLQNARRYGGPNISACLAQDAKALTITIEDDGPGLSATEKSQAFDRFFRGSNASGQGVEGSGLGLPVVKSIIEAHGGTVNLQDADKGGLRVVISLPKEPLVRVVATNMAARKSA